MVMLDQIDTAQTPTLSVTVTVTVTVTRMSRPDPGDAWPTASARSARSTLLARRHPSQSLSATTHAAMGSGIISDQNLW